MSVKLTEQRDPIRPDFEIVCAQQAAILTVYGAAIVSEICNLRMTKSSKARSNV